MSRRQADRGRRQRRGAGRPADETKRRAIIEAASRAFFEQGYASTSIEQVAGNAGVSKVTIYNHFGDKRTLFTAAVEQECEKLRDLFSIEANPGAPIAERLGTIGRAMMAFLGRPEMLQFDRRIAAETELEPAIGRAFLEAGPRRMQAAFSAFLAHAGQAGELRVPDADLAAEQFVALCKGMSDVEQRFGCSSAEADSERRIAGAVEVFLQAYGR